MQFQNEEITKVGRGNPLSISWELVTHCQFACTYCYFNPYESNTNYTDLMKMVLTKLEKVNEPMELTLLGGEPTLHPQFYELIERLHSLENVKKIDIVTNFHKPAEFWEPLIPYSNKIDIIMSYHVEYAQNNFFKKIQQLKDKFSMTVHFLIHNDVKYLPKMNEAADDYFKLGLEDIAITCNKLIDHSGNSNKYYPYQEETLEFLRQLEQRIKTKKNPETIRVHTQNQEAELTQLEFVNNNYNYFKGWKCQMNALLIHPDGFVSYPCTNQKKHILFAELKKRTLNCAHEVCTCAANWNYTKSKS